MKSPELTPLQKLSPLDLLFYFEESCQPRMKPYSVKIDDVIYGYFSLREEVAKRLGVNFHR